MLCHLYAKTQSKQERMKLTTAYLIYIMRYNQAILLYFVEYAEEFYWKCCSFHWELFQFLLSTFIRSVIRADFSAATSFLGIGVIQWTRAQRLEGRSVLSERAPLPKERLQRLQWGEFGTCTSVMYLVFVQKYSLNGNIWKLRTCPSFGVKCLPKPRTVCR